MLTLTQNAADAIRGIVEDAQLPDGSGVRIAAVPGSEGGDPVLSLTLEESPDEADQVVEELGALVFVAHQVAPYLDDKVLDARLLGDRLSFALLSEDDEED